MGSIAHDLKWHESKLNLSIVTALHNRVELTRNFIKSLLATLPKSLSYEVILVDDMSTDGTAELISSLNEPFKVIFNKARENYAINNNKGALAARGENLLLLNNDMWMTDNWLEPMLEVQKNRNAGIVGNLQINARTGLLDHAGIAFAPDGTTFHRNKQRKAKPAGDDRQVKAVSAACMLIKRKDFMQLRGFDEAFNNGSEDVDLCIRARLMDMTIYVSHKSSVLHHVSSSPGRQEHVSKNRQRLNQKWDSQMRAWAEEEWAQAYLSRYAREFWKLNPKLTLKAISQLIYRKQPKWKEK